MRALIIRKLMQLLEVAVKNLGHVAKLHRQYVGIGGPQHHVAYGLGSATP